MTATSWTRVAVAAFALLNAGRAFARAELLAWGGGGFAAAVPSREGLGTLSGSPTQQTRIAVVVGNNLGNDPARGLKYAEQEVDRLARVLKGAGDFASVLMVRSGGRGDVEQALGRARAQLAEAKSAGHATLFLFYYSGHGDNEALELGASRLPLRDLRGYLENLAPADVKLAFVDACQSGALTGVKGGRRAPGYEVRLADPGQVKGMAIVTSSTANELSQESDDLHGSYFSHNVMAGLQGAADASGDGQVTLGELYQYTFKRTLASTAASLVGGQHPTYDYKMAGAGDVVLTRARGGDAQLRFPRESGATYTVFHPGRDEVIAELASSTGEDLYLALPAGSYRVVRRTMGSVKERAIALAAGTASTLEPGTMTPLLLAEHTLRKKGGGIEDVQEQGPELGARTAIGVHGGVSTSVLPGTSSLLTAFGATLSRVMTPWLVLRLRGELSSFDADHFGYRSSVLRTALAADALLPAISRDRFSLMLGPTVGVPIVRQHDFRDETTRSYGFTWGGVGVAAVRVAAGAWATVQATAGGELFRLDGAARHKPTAGVALGALYAF